MHTLRRAPTTQLDGVDALLIIAAVMLVLLAPLLPAWWSFGLAGGGLIAYMAYAIYARHHRR